MSDERWLTFKGNLCKLSQKELLALSLVAKGFTVAQAAERRCRSYKTIEAQLCVASRKLGLSMKEARDFTARWLNTPAG